LVAVPLKVSTGQLGGAAVIAHIRPITIPSLLNFTQGILTKKPGPSRNWKMTTDSLEERIAVLETEYKHALDRIAALESRIPNSAIISPRFLSRAFTVWGHVFVAQLIIVVPIYCVILAITMLLAAGR
jgi:hypothetical protein